MSPNQRNMLTAGVAAAILAALAALSASLAGGQVADPFFKRPSTYFTDPGGARALLLVMQHSALGRADGGVAGAHRRRAGAGARDAVAWPPGPAAGRSQAARLDAGWPKAAAHPRRERRRKMASVPVLPPSPTMARPTSTPQDHCRHFRDQARRCARRRPWPQTPAQLWERSGGPHGGGKPCSSTATVARALSVGRAGSSPSPIRLSPTPPCARPTTRWLVRLCAPGLQAVAIDGKLPRWQRRGWPPQPGLAQNAVRPAQPATAAAAALYVFGWRQRCGQ